MAAVRRSAGPSFLRVLRCFETKQDLARHLGVSRYLVNYWSRLGFIPHKWVRRVATACIRAGGNVTEAELLNEADRFADLVKGLRGQGVKGRAHVILRAKTWLAEPKPAEVSNAD